LKSGNTSARHSLKKKELILDEIAKKEPVERVKKKGSQAMVITAVVLILFLLRAAEKGCNV